MLASNPTSILNQNSPKKKILTDSVNHENDLGLIPAAERRRILAETREDSMADSTHLKLPYLSPSQALKHVTHNEALLALDTLTQLAVLDRDLGAPPATPAEGDRYIVGGSPTGDWAGKTGKIAAFVSGAWAFHAPEPGWAAYLVDEAGVVTWTGVAWVPVVGLDGGSLRLGINAVADDTNRLAVKSDAVLLSHDDVTPGSGDLRLKLNKADAAHTASLLLQTGFSGRAEIGAAGDDDLHVKVSADGASWTEALVVDSTTGLVGVGTAAPVVALDVGGPVRLGAYAVAVLPDATLGAGQIVYVSDEAGGAVLAFSDGAAWRRVTDRGVVS